MGENADRCCASNGGRLIASQGHGDGGKSCYGVMIFTLMVRNIRVIASQMLANIRSFRLATLSVDATGSSMTQKYKGCTLSRLVRIAMIRMNVERKPDEKRWVVLQQMEATIGLDN